MNFDGNKVIEDLIKADASIRDAAKLVKSVKNYIAQSGIKAVSGLIPELDSVMASLKTVCNADVNSIQGVITKIDQMPFEELRGADDDDVFGEEAPGTEDFNSNPDDIYDPENYIADDQKVASAISASQPATATPNARVAEARVLNKYLKKQPVRENVQYKRGLDMNRIANDMQQDVFADVGYSTPTMRESYTSQNQIDLENLAESGNLPTFSQGNGFQKMQEELKRQGITRNRKEDGAGQFLRMLEKGSFTGAQREVLNEAVAEKLDEGKSLSWQELGASALDEEVVGSYGKFFPGQGF